MEIKELRALVTVAEVGSVTKAARVLHLVQPSVTRQIKLLERELGVELFERTRQGMVPTTVGSAFIERARRALRELEQGAAEARPNSEGVSGMVALGLLESVAEAVVEPLLEAIIAEHPRIEMRLLTAYSGHLQHWLDAGDVDLSLLYNLDSTPSLSVVPLVNEALWVVAPPGSGLNAEAPLAWSSLLTQRLVLPVPGHGLRTLIDQTLAHVEIEPDIAAQVNSMQLQKLLVAHGHGWTVLPAAGVAKDSAAGIFDAAPLATPTVARRVVLGLPRSGRLTPPVQAVATTIMGVVHTLVRSGSWPGTIPD